MHEHFYFATTNPYVQPGPIITIAYMHLLVCGFFRKWNVVHFLGSRRRFSERNQLLLLSLLKGTSVPNNSHTFRESSKRCLQRSPPSNVSWW